jgi:hypothetical protein
VEAITATCQRPGQRSWASARLGSFRDDLRPRAPNLPGNDADRRRILELIQHEDEVLAMEFLAMAEAGRASYLW